MEPEKTVSRQTSEGEGKKAPFKMPEKMTPMLEQYFYWKKKYPQCILFFRMGDFFECFYDDAKLISRELDLALTARDTNKNLPMAGVPHHAVDQYAARLIEKGYKIAVCEQMTPPDGRTLVERQVVKILTPGTFIPEEGTVNAALASLIIERDRWTVGFLTPSASSVQVGTFTPEEARSVMMSFSPREILVPRGKGYEKKLDLNADCSLTEALPEDFDPNMGLARLCHLWEINSLEGFGLEKGDPRIGAACALVTYSEETSFSKAAHIRGITKIMPDGYMHLDWNTQTNLDLWNGNDSLFSCLDVCSTSFGKKTMRDWIARPLCDIEKINSRFDAVQALFERAELSAGLSELLLKCHDVGRAIARLHMKSSNPRDLGAIRDTLDVHPEIYAALGDLCPQADLPAPEGLSELRSLLDRALLPELPRSLGLGALVASGYDAELDQWRSLGDSGDQWLEKFAARQRERLGISKLKVGYNKVFGYYIEISRAVLNGLKLPEEYTRKQTLVNAERFITPELKEYEERRLHADIKIAEIEQRIFDELTAACLERTAEIQRLGEALARIDVFNSFASTARQRGYRRPEITDQRRLEIHEGRHPMVERALRGQPCIPNDLTMDLSHRTALVTGPNMAGKSTYLRMAAVLQIMAQAGSFIPAASAVLPLTDRVFTRIGAHDELAKGNSTFMVEMMETSNILHNVTPRSLVILDEIGRGTSTYDGMSIAWAVIEFLHSQCGAQPFVLFATHYHELTELEKSMPGLFNLSMTVEESSEGVRFLHKIKDGPADRSYGIEVARIAGLPRKVLKRAREILEHLEQERLSDRRSVGNAVPLQQVSLFDLSGDAFIEEMASLDPDQMSPRQALDEIYRLTARAKKLRCE
ncbi:MAG: DNA mismatch repair protein MutS [Pyramidobacter sp.]|jgi:DNA mismatch repair protein MutS